MEITKEALRRLSIEKQGLAKRSAQTDKNGIMKTVGRLGCVQIDSINVVERAHYLTLWSRLGAYEKNDLYDLAYRDRRLFEYWAHAACYIPLEDYRYFTPTMEVRKPQMARYVEKYSKSSPVILDEVLDRIEREGPLGARDFKRERERRSQGWWDWKPAKVALEALFGAGVLMISHRENFQRFYDLTENVLPGWVETETPSKGERVRFMALRTMGALGGVRAKDLRGYYLPWSLQMRMTSRQWQEVLEGLTGEGEIVECTVEGENQPYYCLSEDADLIPKLKESPRPYSCRLLTNFDNLLWDRERVKSIFEFKVKLETYKPKDQRKYGYYNLPILYKDRLVGRIVPKMDRKRATLIVHSIWHEPWFNADEEFIDAFDETLRGFARFNGAEIIEREEERPRIG
ncbi:MAG: crosslink repair DNA glycosylase YcaQ family protein [Candidatus Bathyarchaeota archaeon]|jgi:hypothetical protein